jgi:uncharacterized membrane protein YedE/YeeE
MFDLAKFFTLSYLFELRPDIAPQTLKYLAAFFIILIIAGLIIKIIMAKKERFLVKLGNKYFLLLLTMGTLGLVLTWLRYEQAQILSARFWLLAWLIAFFYWLAMVIKYQLKVAPKSRQQAEARKLSQKYSK